MKVCTIEGCDKPFTARGYCSTHYAAARRTGVIELRRAHPRKDNTQRVLALVDRSAGPDACWPWLGAKGGQTGYGRTYLFEGSLRREMSAHRAVYTVLRGEIPEGLYLLHSCDNPPCCNPAHLRPGTNRENMADRQRSGLLKPNGNWSPRFIPVDDETAAAVRAAHMPRVKGHTIREVAADFGLDQAMVWQIVNYKGRWAESA